MPDMPGLTEQLHSLMIGRDHCRQCHRNEIQESTDTRRLVFSVGANSEKIDLIAQKGIELCPRPASEADPR